MDTTPNSLLYLHFQPIYDLASRKLHSMEALLRTTDPGFSNTSALIRMLESRGDYDEVSTFIVNEALSALQFFPDSNISVNISALDLRNKKLARTIERLCQLHNVLPHRLDIEITEQHPVSNCDISKETIRHLKELGTSITIDDFGTGYNNYINLLELPIDQIKIDQSIIQNLPTSELAVTITKSILTLCKGSGIRVVAEGVETSLQHEALMTLDCDRVQGFYYQRPCDCRSVLPEII